MCLLNLEIRKLQSCLLAKSRKWLEKLFFKYCSCRIHQDLQLTWVYRSRYGTQEHDYEISFVHHTFSSHHWSFQLCQAHHHESPWYRISQLTPRHSLFLQLTEKTQWTSLLSLGTLFLLVWIFQLLHHFRSNTIARVCQFLFKRERRNS